MAQVASDKPFSHPSVEESEGCHPHAAVGLCNMRLEYPSEDIQVLGLAFKALYHNCSA